MHHKPKVKVVVSLFVSILLETIMLTSDKSGGPSNQKILKIDHSTFEEPLLGGQLVNLSRGFSLEDGQYLIFHQWGGGLSQASSIPVWCEVESS